MELNCLGSLILTLPSISSVTWSSSLTSPSLRFLICKKGIILHRIVPKIKVHNICEALIKACNRLGIIWMIITANIY